MPPSPRTTSMPIYEYTVLRKPDANGVQSQRTVRALGYREDGPWTIFDDAYSTTLTVRSELIEEIVRGDRVDTQEVEQL